MANKELKDGDVVKLKKDHVNVADNYMHHIAGAKAALKAVGQQLSDSEKQLWDFLNNAYPEIKKYRGSYVMGGKIIIERKLKDYEIELAEKYDKLNKGDK